MCSFAQSFTEASRSKSWSCLSWKNLAQHVPFCQWKKDVFQPKANFNHATHPDTKMRMWVCVNEWRLCEQCESLRLYLFLSLSPLTSPPSALVPSNRTQTIPLPFAYCTVFLVCLSLLSCIFVLPLDKRMLSVSPLSLFTLFPALWLERRWMSVLLENYHLIPSVRCRKSDNRLRYRGGRLKERMMNIRI